MTAPEPKPRTRYGIERRFFGFHGWCVWDAEKRETPAINLTREQAQQWIEDAYAKEKRT